MGVAILTGKSIRSSAADKTTNGCHPEERGIPTRSEEEPKTERSRRTIALPETCIQALRKHRLRQVEEQLAFEGVWNSELDLVFVTRHGTPLDPSNARKQFQRVVRDAGLPPTRFHGLRHLSASLWAAQGVDARVVMEILGHSQMATTMDLYSHLFDDVKRDAAERLNQLLS